MLKVRKEGKERFVPEKLAKHYIQRGYVVVPVIGETKPLNEEYVRIAMIKDKMLTNAHPCSKYYNVTNQNFMRVKLKPIIVKKENLHKFGDEGTDYEIVEQNK